MMTTILNVSRRDFLKGAAGTSGLVLAFHVGFRRLPFADAAESTAFAPNVYLSIDETGQVSVVAHRSEMGTGIRTGLPMVLADELEADWTRVTVVQGTGDAKYGDQNTDGSRSTWQFYQVMREAGAAARQMLETAAAQTWGAPASECQARNHSIVHVPTGRELAFGELVKTAATLPVPPADHLQLRLKDAKARRYVGKSMPIVDLKDIVRGKAAYGIDIVVPGMKHASVERCPVYGGKVKSFDPKDALTVAGVERVVEIAATPLPSGFNPLGGVAVIAKNTWAAQEGRRRLKIEWDYGPNTAHDTTSYRAELEETAKKPGRVVRNQGDVDRALQSAAVRLSADYFVPYYAHSPMEVPAAVARVTANECEVWAPTQNPQGARTTLADVLGLKEADVTVNVTLLGGGFGRKSKPDFIAEAAVLSQKINAPVKVTWTREDEIKHDYFHAVSAQHLEAGLDQSGHPTAWLHRTVFPPIESTFQPGVTYGSAGELQQGVTDVPYAIANVRCENGAATNHVRIGWYRSVFNIPHAFAVCSFADELAAAAGKDPLQYLRMLLGPPRTIDLKAIGVDYPNYGAPMDRYPIDTQRMRTVLDLAAESSGWGRPLPSRHGRGIAVHRSFLSYVAAVAEVAVDDEGQITVPRLDIAIDCGLAVNPDRVRSQLEGAAIMAISNTLYSNITVRQGQIEQSNFNDYLLARIEITPETHVHIVESSAPPGGVGEPGVPPIAPAICNAVHRITGKRVRSLPIDPAQLRVSS
ncbi:MAG: isoquinoline 1-oxidoreductase subunit beta [Candidatus Binatota bacterium]|nr:isoquinoline 1-oxidoreductase subunit beta [Candidatus Binatota bacterium]